MSKLRDFSLLFFLGKSYNNYQEIQ
jgi:hypothetical protein